MFEGQLADERLYDREDIPINDASERAGWHDLEAFRSGSKRLYPNGLLDLLG